MGTISIPLTKGQVAIIDEEDFELVNRYRWQAMKSRYTYYATTSFGTHPKRTWMMHRLIMGAHPGDEIDHADGNGLNNRRGNLRPATNIQNARNRRKHRGISRFKGVSRTHLTTKPWKACIQLKDKTVHIGTYKTEEDAALAYDAVARAHFGEFAWLNFKDRNEPSFT